jgi:hypothetical protein
MKCPNCGMDMNHHADKIVHFVDSGGADLELGGVLQEVHCCPGCGRTEMRIAS